jgi:hypothetical protein
MFTSPSRAAAFGTAIAIIVSGCASGGGGQVPPTLQSQSALPNVRHADATVSSNDSGFSSTCTWSILPSTNPTYGLQNLHAVEAASNSDAWAVGEDQGSKTLALHWNGATWTRFTTLNPVTNHEVQLSSVSEVASNDVWAVGSYSDSSWIVHTVAEHWDGAHWTIVPTPPTPSGARSLVLEAVKMIAHDNGWAVGSENTSGSNMTVIEHWDGHSWTRVPSPNAAVSINDLRSIAVISPSDIWATGNAYGLGSIVLHYDGANWALARTVPVNLEALAAASGSEIFNVGYYNKNSINQSYAEEYHGTTWLQQTTPNAGTDTVVVYGAAAVSATEVFAVGFHYHTAGSTNQPFAMMWNGTSWVLSQPLAVDSTVLNAVAAIPGTKDAFAVGISHNTTTDTYKTLIERVHCL